MLNGYYHLIIKIEDLLLQSKLKKLNPYTTVIDESSQPTVLHFLLVKSLTKNILNENYFIDKIKVTDLDLDMELNQKILYDFYTLDTFRRILVVGIKMNCKKRQIQIFS